MVCCVMVVGIVEGSMGTMGLYLSAVNCGLEY